MALLPANSSTLDLTIGFSSVIDLDINQVPISVGDDCLNNNNNNNDNDHEDQDQELMMISRESLEIDHDEEMSNMNGCGTARKKLRLTKEQSFLLEESFRQHHTLNPKQKEGLALQLNLRPRQVEVWFQNRRARSKLKQTEMECEYLKRWFGSLTEEKRRLERELEELRAIKVGTCEPSTLTMCPRCERVTTTQERV